MNRGKALRALGAGLLMVSLTGCVKAEMQLELNSDDTVDGSMVFALSKDMQDMAAAMGEDPDAMFDQMDTDLPEGTETEHYEDDEFSGKRYTFDGADLSEFAEESDGFSITHEGEEFVVSGAMDTSAMDPSQMQGMEGLEGQLGGDAADLQGMMESVDISLSITFPGEVIEHNGELDGNTVTWVPEPGETLEVSARAEDSGGGGMPVWLWIVIVLVVIVGLVALLYFMARNRGQSSPEGAGSVPPPPPAGMAASTGETQMGQAEASPVGDSAGAAQGSGAPQEPGASPEPGASQGADGAELPTERTEPTGDASPAGDAGPSGDVKPSGGAETTGGSDSSGSTGSDGGSSSSGSGASGGGI
ncbi:uncharacterized protein DUF3153 [Haloactinopolyspora alba]|uniref:Uncharacterized protein DUF3153 n=1 Tax=Haloactinopolyspora alba TaxID=648780 RepID=A0A2P8EGE3_9ACTN|nr:hypothetical protein [Haloactinopolyspora alba]PSL08548.1 uncharacterized protein DUF3153 [Haloactinopolyspora alba]